jgi:hypothetical protein
LVLQSPAKRPIGTPGSPVEFRGVVLDTDEFKYNVYRIAVDYRNIDSTFFGMISMYFTSGQIDEGGVESERAGGRVDDYGQVLGFSAPSLPLCLAPSHHQRAIASLRTGVCSICNVI